MPGIVLSFCCTSGSNLEGGAFALIPRLQHHAAEAAVGFRDLKGESRFREAPSRLCQPHRHNESCLSMVALAGASTMPKMTP